jgi:RHS repeat-associated protein
VNHQSTISTTSKPPYPFGMHMPGRSFSSGSYRYGFNKGSEKDNEIAGEGNHYTTFFRELDTRLGRWWSVDPKTSKTPWESAYVSMGNNPVRYYDPLGDIFKFKRKDKQAKKDIKSLAKRRNRKYIKFDNDSEEITLDFGTKKQSKIEKILRKDPGLKLIDNLSTTKDEIGNKLYFFYGTQGNTNIGLEMSDIQKKRGVLDYYSFVGSSIEQFIYDDKYGGYDPRAVILNASNQQYSEISKYGLIPLDGFNGKVFISRGIYKKFIVTKDPVYNSQGEIIRYNSRNTLISIPRSTIIYHELYESYLRTVKGLCRDDAHLKAGKLGLSRFFAK